MTADLARFGLPPPDPEWQDRNPGWADVPPDDIRWRPEMTDPNGDLRAAPDDEKTGTPPTILRAAMPIRAPTAIPPRPWAYGSFLMIGQAAALGAVDGGGKGAMVVGICLSMITGRPVLGEHPWRTGPVGIITYEDDVDEWQRRFAAACLFYGLDYASVITQVHFLTRSRGKVMFARDAFGNGERPDEDGIIAALREIGAVLLVIDPFNHAHGADDGNSNVQVARVAGEMTRVAREAEAALLVLHHLRKGSTGSADDLMGATALRATFRSSRILARMTTEEASKLGIKDDAWRYSRISGSKENYAPPPDRATWFKLESQPLHNGDAQYPDGDNLQVTTTWTPPALFAEVTDADMAAIFARIRAGVDDGTDLYSPSRQAKNWVGNAISAITDMTPEKASRIVKQWITNGVLIEKTVPHPKNRNEVQRVELDEAAVAVMGFPAPSGMG